ncbi:hypothetical protein RHO13_04565 [Orbus wheelerorum]|uniref:RCC1 domain-containing protein n=1 Tax=Orbus wheelerorum TaxID=3074111 RepID=UPI00370D683D
MIKRIISFLLISLFISYVYADELEIVKKGNVSRTNLVDTGVTLFNDDVWVWGYRDGGLSGNGKTLVIEWKPPERVSFFVNHGLKISQVTGGIYHIIALDKNGDVWGWGQNGYRQADGKQCASGPIKTPCRVLQGKDVIQIGAGEYVSYALTKNGEVYAWGHGIYGQIGNGLKKASNGVYKIPQIYFGNKKVVMIGSAYEGGYAINDAGEVYGWGDEQSNSFGYQNKANHIYATTPKKLNIPTNGNDIIYICGGEAFTEYLTKDGTVYGMGQKTKLGIGAWYSDTTSRTGNKEVIKIITNVQELYCRYAGSAAIKRNDDKHIYTWGSNLSNDPFYIYSSAVATRDIKGKLYRLDGGKENLYYWNDDGQYFGVGYGAGHKFGPDWNKKMWWPGKEMPFLTNAITNTYSRSTIAEDVN